VGSPKEVKNTSEVALSEVEWDSSDGEWGMKKTGDSSSGRQRMKD